MKELTIEEKAKAYDGALKLARDYHNDKNCFEYLKGVLENIFPELAESEDERIRKWLEETIEGMPENSIDFRDVRRIDVLLWLEKQGESKWSEEDDKMLSSIIEDFGDGKTSNMLQEKWLKLLKQRMEEQQ